MIETRKVCMTVFNNFLSTLNNTYGKVKETELAQALLKKSTNGSTAVVSILETTGIAGFRFHLPETEQVKMENEITDHYIDTNSAIQDHIAQKPITITMHGFQGEYFYSVHPIQDTLAKVIPTISLVKQFLPKLSKQDMKNKTAKLKEVEISQTGALKAGVEVSTNTFNALDLWNLFQELYKLKSAQTRAFFFFEALWKSKAVFSVETTWRRYDNAVILNITPLRDKNADITDFNVSFKVMNFTQSKSEDAKKAAGRVAQQKAEITQKGVDKGKKVSSI